MFRSYLKHFAAEFRKLEKTFTLGQTRSKLAVSSSSWATYVQWIQLLYLNGRNSILQAA